MASQLTRTWLSSCSTGAQKSAILAEAGIVDEDIDREAGAFGGIVNLLRRGGVVEVGGDDADLGSLAAELGGQRLQTVFAARGEDELAPCPASSRARATPIPALAPVTSAHLPLKSCVFAIAVPS